MKQEKTFLSKLVLSFCETEIIVTNLPFNHVCESLQLQSEETEIMTKLLKNWSENMGKKSTLTID
jgi:hypothetical protein